MTDKELIRCKDCRFFTQYKWGSGFCHRLKTYMTQTEDGFCSFAENKKKEMTIEDAKKIMKNSVSAACGYTCGDVKKAKDMALEALEFMDKYGKNEDEVLYF